MEISLVEAKTLQGLIVTEARRLARQNGRSYMSKDDYSNAVKSVAMMRGDTDPQDLQKSVMRTISTLSVQSARNGRPKANAAPIAGETKPATDTKERVFFSGQYREWVENNDIIPDDKAIEFFTGNSSPSYIRSDLRKEGYDFELIGRGAGYRVTKRPVKRTIEDVLSELAEAMKNGHQVTAAARIMELMELNKAA